MIKELKEKFNAPTPLKWRKVGAIITHLGTTLQVVIAAGEGSETFELPGKYFYWVIGIALIQWAGHSISELATDKPEDIG